VTGTEYAMRGSVADSDKSNFTGLASLVAATTMLFAALTSAYVVRRGLAGDWIPVQLPLIIPASVVLLILGSLALHRARTAATAGRAFARMWYGGLACGALFIAIQVFALRHIAQTAVSVASSPAPAFVYVLTGAFVLFLCGTMAAGIWAGVKTAHQRMKMVAQYWHYLSALWIFLIILLFLRS
jgi:cytochrome c oxidase subunit 3